MSMQLLKLELLSREERVKNFGPFSVTIMVITSIVLSGTAF